MEASRELVGRARKVAMNSMVNRWTSKSTWMIGTVIRRMLATRTRWILAALGPTISVWCGMPKRMGLPEIALVSTVIWTHWVFLIRDFWNFSAFSLFQLLHLTAPFRFSRPDF